MLIESFSRETVIWAIDVQDVFPGVMQPIWWCFLCLGLGGWFPSANWVEKNLPIWSKCVRNRPEKKVSAERLESSLDLLSHRELLCKKNDICSFHGIRRKVDLYIHSTTFNITNLESMGFMVPEIGVIGTIYKPAQGKMCEYRNIYIYLYKCIYIDTCYISGIHCQHRVMVCYLHTC